MVDSDGNDIYNSYITKANYVITDYINKKFSLNINESFIESIIKNLLDQNVLEKSLLVRETLCLLLQTKIPK